MSTAAGLTVGIYGTLAIGLAQHDHVADAQHDHGTGYVTGRDLVTHDGADRVGSRLGEVAGGAAEAGVEAVAQATATWQIRPTRRRRSASACRLVSGGSGLMSLVE